VEGLDLETYCRSAGLVAEGLFIGLITDALVDLGHDPRWLAMEMVLVVSRLGSRNRGRREALAGSGHVLIAGRETYRPSGVCGRITLKLRPLRGFFLVFFQLYRLLERPGQAFARGHDSSCFSCLVFMLLMKASGRGLKATISAAKRAMIKGVS